MPRLPTREGVPKDLVYLAMVESGFDPGALSNAGAGGVWQFIKGAARAYGLEVSYWVDNRRDPERAAEAAARYLKDLYVRFGSWPLAFAAYNAGYGAVLKSIARYNTNDFWELVRHEAGLPWETTLYVPKILACAVIGHNLNAFGFDAVAPDPPLAYDVVEVAPGTALERVARAAGVAVEDVQNLNPELIRGRTPPDRGPSLLRVPPGVGEAFARNFHKSATKSDQLEAVVLRFGETLDDLAKARGLSARELRKLNGLGDSRELAGGTTVVVPLGPRPAEDELAAKTREASAPPAEETILVAVPDREFSYEGRERVFYQTKSADTLEDVAAGFEVSIENLLEWNNVDPEAKLQEGMILQLFIAEDFDRNSVALLDPAKLQVVTLGSEEFLALRAAQGGKTRLSYKAKPGDTLAKIARRYGLRPNDLARINRLSYNASLEEGQDVIVYSPSPELPREHAVGHTAPGARRPAGGASDAAHQRARPPSASTKTSAASQAGGKPASKTTSQRSAPKKTATAAPKGGRTKK
ncbi:MAG: transglycosylase SLT domain-containing protein [Myxococcales bacterium]|nr:transglycosylase SLT domain-containing protein [Myxococcales bacterium]